MPINLLGITAQSFNPVQLTREQNFVKNAFNFRGINSNHPACKVCNSPLGDPDRAVVLDCLA